MPKFVLNYDIRKTPKNFIKTKKYRNKSIILNYMKSGEKCGVTSERVKDAFSGEYKAIFDDLFTDGEYVWANDVVYHFDKYDLEIADDFIQKIENLQI